MRDEDVSASRCYRITAEIDLVVVDGEGLKQAALAQIEAMHYVVNTDSGQTEDDARAAERLDVAGNAAAAIELLADPESVLDHASVRICSTTHWVEELTRDDSAKAPVPDFASLFAPCSCDRSSCPRCSGFQLTARSAAVLWRTVTTLADQAFDDVLEHGDLPVGEGTTWMVFDELPRSTWEQDAVWRRQFARSLDDLAGDLEAGRAPFPRCLAEAWALRLAILYAEAAVKDDWAGLDDQFSDLPECPNDLDWMTVADFLLPDDGLLPLYTNHRAGRDGFKGDQVKKHREEKSSQAAWFVPSGGLEPRDPRRPFRR